MSPFLSLPNELILDMSEYLAIQDISALLQTNRRLSNLLTKALVSELIRSRSRSHGRRLLYQLSSQKDIISVTYLISRGILTFTDPDTLLHEAVISQSVHVLETLLHFSLDPDTKDSKSRTPLGLAAKHGRVDWVKILAARRDVGVDWRNYKFMTPLLLAVQEGREVIVQILVLSASANVRLWNECGQNSLHLAALKGYVPILRFLLDFIDADEQDYHGLTALHLAAGAGNRLAVKYLLQDQGVDVNAQDRQGETSLHAAVVGGHVGVLEYLLSCSGVEINRADCSGQTLLHAATSGESIRCVRLLLSWPGADVNLREESPVGNTALHTAIEVNNPEIVKLFLRERRVDLKLQNLRGRTPTQFAVLLGRSQFIHLLFEACTDLTQAGRWPWRWQEGVGY